MKAQWKLAAPALDKIAGLPIKLSGSIEGSGDASLKDRTLENFSAVSEGGLGLGVDDHRLKSLQVDVKGDLKAISFDVKALADAGDGQLDATGNVGLEGQAPRAVSSGSSRCRDPRSWRSRSALPATPHHHGRGESRWLRRVDLAQLKAKKFDDAKGLGTLDVKAVTWNRAPCDSVHVEWSLERGVATLSALQLMLPGSNQLQASGHYTLAAEQVFDGKLRLNFAALPALKPWFEALGQKPITEGLLHIDWAGQGKLKPALALSGQTKLLVTDLHLPDRPEKIELQTELTHDLESATFSSLIASFGPWSADLKGKVSKTAIDLTIQHAQHGVTDLIRGVVQVPLDLKSKPVPVDATKPMHIALAMPQALALHQLADIAKAKLPEDVSGTAMLSLGIDGPLSKPEAKIAVLADELHLPRALTTDVGKVSLDITLKDEQLHTALVADVKPIEPLHVTVDAQVQTMPLIEKPASAMDLPFTAAVKLDQRSLEFVKPLVPMLLELSGAASIARRRMAPRASRTSAAWCSSMCLRRQPPLVILICL